MPLVEISNVHKSFGQLEVLKGINIEVEEGDITVLIGRSGSGKSTLLRCVNGLEVINSGSIHVDGVEVTHERAKLRKLRQSVGIVFQSFNLFPHLTVAENIMLAPSVVKKISRGEAHDIAVDVLEKVGLTEKIDSYPEQLSGGQQQRVAIARSLAMTPKVMLFDEVTSALDPELIGEVLNVMEDLAKQGMTMILVTHEMGFAKNVANQVVFMHEGRIHESGPPAEIFREQKTAELKAFIASVL